MPTYKELLQERDELLRRVTAQETRIAEQEKRIAFLEKALEEAEEQRPGRCIYQKRVSGPSESKVYLLSVFVDVDRDPAEVVSAYRTSKVGKYWRLYARDL